MQWRNALKEQDGGMDLHKWGTMKLVVYIHLMMQCISISKVLLRGASAVCNTSDTLNKDMHASFS